MKVFKNNSNQKGMFKKEMMMMIILNKNNPKKYPKGKVNFNYDTVLSAKNITTHTKEKCF